MKTCVVVFPHQCFENHPGFDLDPDEIFITEDPLFFGDARYPMKFHKQKLVLHRASLKAYQAYLDQKKYKVNYFEYVNSESDLNNIFVQIKKSKIEKLYIAEVTDFLLEKRLKHQAQKHNIEIKWLETPMFLNTQDQNKAYREGKKRWYMADFYRAQRRRLNILMTGDKPVGDQWSFDEANRKKLPKAEIEKIPKIIFPAENEFVEAAKKYVETNFAGNYGNLDRFWYPTDFESAKCWFEQFLETRFVKFGPYEDALEPDENWIYHSILSPLINIGLLTPRYVIDEALKYASENEVPIESLEGFVRQIIGWREFMRATYEDLGVTMRTTNCWDHREKLTSAYYTGETGIVPVDNTIKRVLDTAYCHHIERLMVLGGFMFLVKLDPDEIYTWFMEMFIDSYDWVMVPNVYAMSQNADGGNITTKPYFSGSNYIRKMSHYEKGEWCDVWDGLYWTWILDHAEMLAQNPRWAMMVRLGQRMDLDKVKTHRDNAHKYVSKK